MLPEVVQVEWKVKNRGLPRAVEAAGGAEGGALRCGLQTWRTRDDSGNEFGSSGSGPTANGSAHSAPDATAPSCRSPNNSAPSCRRSRFWIAGEFVQNTWCRCAHDSASEFMDDGWGCRLRTGCSPTGLLTHGIAQSPHAMFRDAAGI